MNADGNRIQIRGAGLGEVSDADIERRASELALADGRQKVNAADRSNALEELRGTSISEAPEISESTEGKLDERGLSPGTVGSKAASSFPQEDENALGANLFNEGLDEADHDTRTQS